MENPSNTPAAMQPPSSGQRCLGLFLRIVILLVAVACCNLPNYSVSLGQTVCTKKVLSPAGVLSLDVSPDGKQLLVLYGQKPTGIRKLAIINFADGKVVRTLNIPDTNDPDYALKRPMNVYAAEWGKTNNEIIYVSTDKLKELSLPSGKVSIIGVCPACFLVTISSKGQVASLQSIRARDNLVEVRPSLNANSVLATARGAINQAISFSPDGMRVAFATSAPASEVSASTDLTSSLFSSRVVVLDITSNRNLTTTSDALFSAVWLTNNSLLVPDTKEMKLWKLSLPSNRRTLYLDLSKVSQAGQRIAGLAMTQNGRYIAYQTFTDIFEDLYIVDTACVKQHS